MNYSRVTGRSFGLMLILSTILLIASCADVNSNQEDKSNSEENNVEEQEKYTLILNSSFPKSDLDGEPKNIAIEKFAEQVALETDDRVEIEIHYSNELVPQDQAFDALKSGIIDIEVAGSYWGDAVPEMDFPWLPFGFLGPDHMNHVMRETEMGEIYEEKLEEQGVKPLMYWPADIYTLLSKEPIKKIEDLKGKTVRLSSGLWTNWFQELGSAPANTDAAELYEALMRGTIDVAQYPPYTLETNKLHEVVDHVTVPGILDPISVMHFMSLDTWEQLPEDIQQIIEEVAIDIEEDAINSSKDLTNQAFEFAEKHDITVHSLSREEYDKFVESSQTVWDEFESKNDDTKRMVELLKENQESYLKENSEAKEWMEQWFED